MAWRRSNALCPSDVGRKKRSRMIDYLSSLILQPNKKSLLILVSAIFLSIFTGSSFAIYAFDGWMSVWQCRICWMTYPSKCLNTKCLHFLTLSSSNTYIALSYSTNLLSLIHLLKANTRSVDRRMVYTTFVSYSISRRTSNALWEQKAFYVHRRDFDAEE